MKAVFLLHSFIWVRFDGKLDIDAYNEALKEDSLCHSNQSTIIFYPDVLIKLDKNDKLLEWWVSEQLQNYEHH